MAVSTRTDTYGLLNAWQRRMMLSGWQFNQITGAGVDAPVSTPGEQVWVQPERETVAEGIKQALALAVPQLQFYPRPVYHKIRVPLSWRQPVRHQTLDLGTRYIQSIGARGATLIEAGVTVVYSDEDGDGVDDTATITVSTTVTDPTQVQLFFKTTDSLSTLTADARWQVEPVTVSISGGTATITGPRWLFANPSLWRTPYQSPNYNSSSKVIGDTTDPNDFVTEVDVYQIAPTSTGAVTVYCQDTSDGVDTVTGYSGGGIIVDGPGGMIRLYLNESCPCQSGWGAKYADVWVYSGYPLDPSTGDPEYTLELAMIRLANSMMMNQTPTADARNNIWYGDTQTYPAGTLPQNLLNNPFGVKTGQVEAWRLMRGYRWQSVRVLGG